MQSSLLSGVLGEFCLGFFVCLFLLCFAKGGLGILKYSTGEKESSNSIRSNELKKKQLYDLK